MREVVGAGGESAGNDNGGLDSPAIQLCGIADSKRIHSGLSGKVGRKVRWRPPARAGASDPEDQSFLLVAQLWERSAVNPLRAEHICVIDLQELFGSEGLCRTKDHVPRVMDDDVETAVILDDSFNRLVG